MNVAQAYTDIQGLNNLIIRIGKKEPAAIRELSRVHELVYGEPVCVTCSHKHIKAFHKLTNLTIENLQAMSERKYKLKPNVVITVGGFGSSEHYTNHNLTDEVAKKFLAEDESNVKLFAEYPKEEKEVKKSKATDKE